MKLKTVIQLAKQAGLHLNAEGEIVAGQFDSIPRFAALVAAHEREACVKVCNDLWQEDGTAMDCRDSIRSRA